MDEPRLKQTAIHMDRRLHDRLVARAAEQRRSRTEVIERALRMYLSDHPGVVELRRYLEEIERDPFAAVDS